MRTYVTVYTQWVMCGGKGRERACGHAHGRPPGLRRSAIEKLPSDSDSFFGSYGVSVIAANMSRRCWKALIGGDAEMFVIATYH